MKQILTGELIGGYWKVLVEQKENCERILAVEWGEVPDVVVIPNDTSKDVYRRHEADKSTDFRLLESDGAASTTKKIVNNSIASRKKMAGFDNVLI